MIHVAILKPEYIEPIVEGTKRIESRITHSARAPFDRIDVGERIYFKASAGPFRATALVDHVIFVRDLNPQRIRKLKADYNHAILGSDDYWKSKRNARFATLIWLKRVQAISHGPRVPKQRGIAWVPLPDSECVYPSCLSRQPPATAPIDRPRPTAEPGTGIVVVTGGNIRNGHVYFRGIRTLFPTDAFGGRTKEAAGIAVMLELEGGPSVETDLVEDRGIFRSRSWRKWFEQIGIQPGDGLRFRRLERRRYVVTYIPKGRTLQAPG